MDADEKEIEKHVLNNMRSLEFYYRNKTQILEKRRTNVYKARQCLYQQAYYAKKKALKQKQIKPLQIKTVETQQEPSFTLSFTWDKKRSYNRCPTLS